MPFQPSWRPRPRPLINLVNHAPNLHCQPILFLDQNQNRLRYLYISLSMPWQNRPSREDRDSPTVWLFRYWIVVTKPVAIAGQGWRAGIDFQAIRLEWYGCQRL